MGEDQTIKCTFPCQVLRFQGRTRLQFHPDWLPSLHFTAGCRTRMLPLNDGVMVAGQSLELAELTCYSVSGPSDLSLDTEMLQ